MEMAGDLAGRPGEGPSADEVDVEVGHGLSGVGAFIDDEAVTGGEALRFGDDAGGAEQVLVVSGGLDGGDAGDLGFGDDEDVDGGDGVDVADGEAVVVLVDDVTGDFAVEDAGEEGGHV